ncbi:SigE family RNA polymerase sigma factor [Cellulomonas sp. P22]|uniref:SigE family RNA polymerase sigma factor n=1 Tax=Cellulomonas sp. P22 TaxID=3373189 RepID=UPI00379B23E5
MRASVWTDDVLPHDAVPHDDLHHDAVPDDDVDVRLVRATRGARDAEFTVFATAAQDDLGRMAWLLTGDTHAAAELVQVALVRTYVAWPRARERDPLAYARRVMANARIDVWRRRRREVLVAPEDVPDGFTAAQGAAVEDRDELVRALAALSTRQRRVVVLRYLMGLSEREVADDLGVSVGTVKSQASRGLRRLRTSLGEPVDDDPRGDGCADR